MEQRNDTQQPQSVNQTGYWRMHSGGCDESAGEAPVIAVVLAAGLGTRFDPNHPKQLVSLYGKPMVCWSIEAFERNPLVDDIMVVVNSQVRDTVCEAVKQAGYGKVCAIVDGGAQRVDSTLAALHALAERGVGDRAKVLIHDAARPLVSQEAIAGCVHALEGYTAATVALASTDTVLLTDGVDGGEVIRSVPERTHTFRAQTPQAFRFGTIVRAYDLARNDPDFHPTDDTRVVVEYLPDEPVAIVSGSESNMKVTTPADVPMIEWWCRTLQR